MNDEVKAKLASPAVADLVLVRRQSHRSFVISQAVFKMEDVRLAILTRRGLR